MAEMELIADGLRFPEAPVVMPDGSVIVVEIEAGRITRCWGEGRKEVIATPGGGPNGLALGPDGMLYLCNNGGFEYLEMQGLLVPHGAGNSWNGGSIQRVDPDTGRVETLYTHAGEVQLRGPNDIVFDDMGGFWFTDHGKTFERSRDVVGVFYAKADGTHIEEAVFPMENPNGIGLSPDGTRLYVAETYTAKLWAFDVEASGKLAKGESLTGSGAQFVYGAGGYSWFDSLGVDSAGNICVATIGNGGISVVSPAGELVEFVPTGDPFTTNICWGGPELRTAYITLSGTGRLVSMEWQRPGLGLHNLNR